MTATGLFVSLWVPGFALNTCENLRRGTAYCFACLHLPDVSVNLGLLFKAQFIGGTIFKAHDRALLQRQISINYGAWQLLMM